MQSPSVISETNTQTPTPPPTQGYPNSVSPYPSSTPNPPAAGPGSGFPPRSGLAGMQPNSYSSAPSMTPGSGAGTRGGLPEEKNVAQVIQENTNVYARKFQALLDRSTPHVVERWLGTGGLFLLFVLSVVLRQGVSCILISTVAMNVSFLRQEDGGGLSWQAVLTSQWYIVCYALAIYILNLFLAFLQPRFDPSLAADLAADDVEEGAPGLPGSSSPKSPNGLRGLFKGLQNGGGGGEEEEFRPFIRRLPGASLT